MNRLSAMHMQRIIATMCVWKPNQLLGRLLQAVDMLILSAGLYIWRQLPIVGRLAAPVVSLCLANQLFTKVTAHIHHSNTFCLPIACYIVCLSLC